jgi:hypothetical protein
MKQGIFMLLLIFSIACTTKVKHQKEVKLITKDTALIENFKQVKLLADSIVVAIFNDDNILSHFNTRYNFEYEGWDKSLSDTLYGKPKKYEFHYDLCLKKDTIKSATIEIDSLNKILYCDIPNFIGFDKFLKGELKITPTLAKEIAIKNCLTAKSLIAIYRVKSVDHAYRADEVYFDTISNYDSCIKIYNNIKARNYRYYWLVKNNCKEGSWIMINSENGKIIDKGKTNYRF